MPTITYGPFQGGLNDRLDPSVLGPGDAVVAWNCLYDSGAIAPILAPAPDDSLPATGMTTVRFMHRLNIGVQAPTSTVTPAASATAGNPNGTYFYMVTFARANGQESLPSPITSGVTATNVQVNLSAIPTSADTTVTKRNLYRRVITAGKTWQLVGTLNDNTTTTFTDNVADASLGAAYSGNWKFLSKVAYSVEDNEKLYYAFEDASQGPRKWNGVSDYLLGIQGPSTAPTAATGAAGNVTGSVQYCVTFLGVWGAESQPSPLSTAVNASSVQVSVSGIPTSGDPQVTARNLYRVGGTGQTQLVATLNDNTTTTFTDNVSNASLGATLLSATWAPPVALSGLTGPHFGSLFGWTGTKLYWSVSGNYDAWPATSYMTFPTKIVRAIPWGGDLIILTASEVWMVAGQDSNSFTKVRLPVTFGCVSGRSVVRSERGILWLTQQGVAMYSSGEPMIISGKLDPSRFLALSNPDDPSALDPVNAAVYYRGYYYAVGYISPGDLVADLREYMPPYSPVIRFQDQNLGSLQTLGLVNGAYLSALHLDTQGVLWASIDGDGRLMRHSQWMSPEMYWMTGEFVGDPPGVETSKILKMVRLELDPVDNTTVSLNFDGSPVLNANGSVTYLQGPSGLTVDVIVDGAIAYEFQATPTKAIYRLPPGIRGKRVQLALYGVFRLRGAAVEYEEVRRP